jgi:hypothetical protein
MLGFSESTGATLVATDGDFKVFHKKSEAYPEQRPPSDELLNLLSSDELLDIFRKFKLKKDDIDKLTEFYNQSDVTTIDLGGKWNLERSFRAVEAKILEKLKTTYFHKGKLFPHFEGRLSLGLQGPSMSGKSHMASSILLQEQFKNRKVYIFSTQPEDSSLQRLNQPPRSKSKNIFMDLEKINRPLKITDFPKEDAICFFDDVFDALPSNSDLRTNLSNLLKSILVRGRHHKKSKNGLGLSAIVVFHMPRQGRVSSSWHIELKDLITFPSSSKASTIDFLRQKYHMPKRELDYLFSMFKGRYFHLHLHQPLYCTAENLVILR